MGTITCNVSSNKKLTITSVAGASPSTTWARFHGAFFEVFGGGSFELALTVPSSSFRFHTTDPIDWGTHGQPSWITVPANTSTALTLRIDSAAVGSRVFTVRNATPGGQSIELTVESKGGSGGASATVEAYVGDDQTALIGPLPAGAMAGGTNVHFGFGDPGANGLLLQAAGTVVIDGVDWTGGQQPSYIELARTSSQADFAIANNTSDRLEATFFLDTNAGRIDPTIITNPDESGP